MRTMPKKIDPKVKERCVRQVLEHLPEYPSLTAAAEAVARREGVGKETVRRWVVQAQVDGGQRQGATSEELAEIKELKAKVRRLEEDNEILRRASIFFARELDPTIADRRVRRPAAGRAGAQARRRPQGALLGGRPR
jgi:transposase-like protein